jgi:serine/threonine-protein kinase
MLTGEKPFSGETPIQIAYMHVNEDVPSLRSIRREIPQVLSDLISRATNRDPDLRPRNAGEFLKDLEAIALGLDPKKNQMRLDLDLPVEPLRQQPRTKVKPAVIPEASIEVKETTKQIRRRDEKKHRTSKRVRRNRKIALLLAVLLGVGGWYTLIGPGSRIVVPSVVGGTYSDAVSAFTPLGITSIAVVERFDEDINSGTIIESIPPGGGRIETGEKVTLVISKGAERYTITSLVGLTPSAAASSIKKSPLKIGENIEVFSNTIPKGFVIGSKPKVGSKVKRNSVVNIIVSKGVETFLIPSYVGMSGEQALNELTESGFNVDSSYSFSENVLAGTVISQNPSGNSRAPKGSSITLSVSKGTEFVFVPNVFSLDEATAVRLLQDLELKVIVKKIGVKTTKKTTNVSPKVGSKVKRGSTVTITVR